MLNKGTQRRVSRLAERSRFKLVTPLKDRADAQKHIYVIKTYKDDAYICGHIKVIPRKGYHVGKMIDFEDDLKTDTVVIRYG